MELASRGEEVLITVRGKIRARLVPVREPDAGELTAWVRELEALSLECHQRDGPPYSEELLAIDREEPLL